MSQLPKTTRVAEALAYARQWLEERKNFDPFGTGVPLLHSKSGAAWLRRFLQFKAMSSAIGMTEVIDDARAGWDEAHAALCELNHELKHRRLDVPPALDVYTTEALVKPFRRSRGRRRSWNIFQDIAFAELMIELVKKFDLDPTRKTEAHRDSVCDILVIVINEAKWLKRSFNYDNAERLWVQLGSPNAI
jgi:hypothetical protein